MKKEIVLRRKVISWRESKIKYLDTPYLIITIRGLEKETIYLTAGPYAMHQMARTKPGEFTYEFDPDKMLKGRIFTFYLHWCDAHDRIPGHWMIRRVK